jgi:AmmeMemoRadiSam system protein B
MREPMLRKDTEKLAQFFHEQLGQETLLVVSADFSHYFPKEIAEAHDKESLTALQTLDIDFMEKKMDIDARQILMVIAQYLKLEGGAKFTMLFHTNSADLTANPYEKSTTSHFVGFYEL